MSYEIKAIPTKYNGIQYRSILEARWAAFFDFIETDFEYEPFTIDGWAPDFLLKGKEGYLVEIKPQSEWTNDMVNKIYRHCKTNKCLLFHDEIYCYPNDPKIYLGKIFNQSPQKNLILNDFELDNLCPVKYSKEFILRLWKDSKNEVQFKKVG